MRVRANPLHPALLRLEADEIEAAPLDAVLKAHPTCGFTCTIFEGDIRAARLLTSRGFTPARRTVEGGWQGDPSAALRQLNYGTLAERPDLTKAWLVAQESEFIAAQGIFEVLGEFDSTSPDAMWRVNHYALTSITAFQTYHLKR